MSGQQILRELEKNKKNQKIGVEVFNVSLSAEEVKQGKSFKDIAEEMEKASKENLLRISDNASYC